MSRHNPRKRKSNQCGGCTLLYDRFWTLGCSTRSKKWSSIEDTKGHNRHQECCNQSQALRWQGVQSKSGRSRSIFGGRGWDHCTRLLRSLTTLVLVLRWIWMCGTLFVSKTGECPLLLYCSKKNWRILRWQVRDVHWFWVRFVC